MACPSMWISVTEKAGACPELCILPAGGPSPPVTLCCLWSYLLRGRLPVHLAVCRLHLLRRRCASPARCKPGWTARLLLLSGYPALPLGSHPPCRLCYSAPSVGHLATL